jgi:hypothetical protein
MEYKFDVKGVKTVVYTDLKPGEWFRRADGLVPLLRCCDNRLASMYNGNFYEPDNKNFSVVRIRIDRVEDGLPVFVDA